jgi:hypothetical protein
MGSFDMQVHPEEINDDYLPEQEYYKNMEKLDNAFTSGIKQLLKYKRIVSDSEYRCAVNETFENAEGDMIDYMFSLGITSFNKFITYLNGVEKGMAIRNE